jgi:hypothetical protein
MEASDVGHRIWVVEIKTRLPTALLTKLAQALAAN